MFNDRFWRAVDASRGIPVERGGRPMERSDGHGQRCSRTDGQPERLPVSGQDSVSTVRYDLPGPVFGVRGRQQLGHYTHGYRTAEGLAKTLLHYVERQGWFIYFETSIIFHIFFFFPTHFKSLRV